jgi:hypothetical protein
VVAGGAIAELTVLVGTPADDLLAEQGAGVVAPQGEGAGPGEVRDRGWSDPAPGVLLAAELAALGGAPAVDGAVPQAKAAMVAADGDLLEADAGPGDRADADAAARAGGQREAPGGAVGADLAGAGVAVVRGEVRGILPGDQLAADAAEEAPAVAALLTLLGEGAGPGQLGGAATFAADRGAARGGSARAVRVLVAVGRRPGGAGVRGGGARGERGQQEQEPPGPKLC